MGTVEFLKQSTGVFKEFSAERLKVLVDGSRVRSFEAGEVIAHQGSEATHLGVVLSGTVSVSAAGDGGVSQPLGAFKAGDTFGELALMTGDPSVADFIAQSRTVRSCSFPYRCSSPSLWLSRALCSTSRGQSPSG